jgi:ribosomal-protein-alanine N-acetyltransferase
MLKPPRPYHLRRMRLSDISSIMSIEYDAFPAPWHESAYQYEISENRLANYQVLSVAEADLPRKLIGYSGFWLMAGEAHVSTIAVDMAWRGRGLGSLLLLNLLVEAYSLNAELATLEVRRSNIAAQSLYLDFQFKIVGGRRRYYQGKEDAIIMTVDPLDRMYRSFLHQKERELYQRIGAGDMDSRDKGTAIRETGND